MENKTPKFKRPNPQGARSKSKIVRAAGRIARVVATIKNDGVEMFRVLWPDGTLHDLHSTWIKTPSDDDEFHFNAQYQRHLRRVDADKIKGKKK